MLFALLRPGKIISLAILIAIVGGAWWAWGRLHRSDPASESAALASVRDAKGADAGTPRPGVYQYLSGGDERIGLGPLSVGRKLPTSALLVVSPSPELAHGRPARLGRPRRGLARPVRAAGLKGIARTIRVGTLGYSREVTGDAVPPVLLRPAKIRRRASPGRRSTRSARSSSTATRRCSTAPP